MAKITKRQKALEGKVAQGQLYPLEQAVELLKNCATAKFPESVDLSVNLGIDAKKSDQNVRGSTVLPHGNGKTVRVAVFTQGAKAEEAKAAGADEVGMEDLAQKMKDGDLNFGVVIASPDAMRVVGQRAGSAPAVAAGAHRLEGDADMGLAVGLAGLARQAAEPELVGRGIADRPFAGALGQLHQRQLARLLLDLADRGERLGRDLVGRGLRGQGLARRHDGPAGRKDRLRRGLRRLDHHHRLLRQIRRGGCCRGWRRWRRAVPSTWPR